MKNNREGYGKLWNWFGLSYASWLTIPRVMMHEMSDEWQSKMADLMQEFTDTWDTSDLPNPIVSAREGNKFTSWPDWLLNYRHPVKTKLNAMKKEFTDVSEFNTADYWRSKGYVEQSVVTMNRPYLTISGLEAMITGVFDGGDLTLISISKGMPKGSPIHSHVRDCKPNSIYKWDN